MKDLRRRLYAKFDENYKDWLKAVKIIAELDCLGSLSKSSSALGCKFWCCEIINIGVSSPRFLSYKLTLLFSFLLLLIAPACRPEFVESESSVLELEGLRHPCVIPGIASDFIPNDTVLGGESPNLILLTGPNMGGKSTLLRQVSADVP